MDRPETIELVGQTLWWRRERAVWETAEPGARPRLVAYAASLARSAEIVRGIIPWRDVERGLYVAAGGVL